MGRKHARYVGLPPEDARLERRRLEHRTPTYPCRTDYVPSDRVLASKGAKPRYTIRFLDSCDPAVRERIGVALTRIDDHPHKDPVPKPFRLIPTEAEMKAAAARVRSYLMPEPERVDPYGECGESYDRERHTAPMSDGRCARCDRMLAEPSGPPPAPEPIEVDYTGVALTVTGPVSAEPEPPPAIVEVTPAIVYRLHSIEHAPIVNGRTRPDVLWTSPVAFNASDERHVHQAVIAGYLNGQPRWATEDGSGRFICGMGADGKPMSGPAECKPFTPERVRAPRTRKASPVNPAPDIAPAPRVSIPHLRNAGAWSLRHLAGRRAA